MSLFADGYTIARDVIHAELLDALRSLARRTIAADPDGYAISKPMSLSYRDADVRALIHLPAMHSAIAAAGLADLRYYSAVLLNSRPAEGPGGWHHDWWAWDAPEASRVAPPELAVFAYLVDTCRDNGCLKVIPGTHRQRSPWCDGFHEIATAEHPHQVDVPVRAGDLVLCDARVIHGRHGNQTAADRPLVTIWFLPGFAALSEPVQAYAAAGAVAADAAEHLDAALIPRYQGTAAKVIPDYKRN